MFKRFITVILMFLLLASNGVVRGKALYDVDGEQEYYAIVYEDKLKENPDCALFQDIIKIEGIQFDEYQDLKLFWFSGAKGYKRVVTFEHPLNTSSAQWREIYSMINLNQRYFVTLQICERKYPLTIVEMYILDRHGKPYKRKPLKLPSKPDPLM